MVTNVVKLQMCALLLVANLFFSLHNAEAALELPVSESIEFVSLNETMQYNDQNRASDVLLPSDEHCSTHFSAVTPSAAFAAFIVVALVEYQRSNKSLFSDSMSYLLRPPKF